MTSVWIPCRLSSTVGLAAALAIFSCTRGPRETKDTAERRELLPDAGAGGDSRGIPPRAIPRIDELGYLAQLKARRPDLLLADCYETLVLKPKYRASVLEGTSSYRSIVSSSYPDDLKARDVAWMKSQHETELRLCASGSGAPSCGRLCSRPCVSCPSAGLLGPWRGGGEPVAPAGYPLCDFVGYEILGGMTGRRADPAGIIDSWKVLFELRDDFHEKLSPETYLEFSSRLAAIGFRGDSKISTNPDAPERARFQYNGIIVHGRTEADAKAAEGVAFELFGTALAGYGRGVDVSRPSRLDWHHFLCAENGDLARLPESARAFIAFRD